MSLAPRYPDFFIVGGQRCGTTSLYEYLGQHPQVTPSPQKETHFFAHDRVQVDRDLAIRSEADYFDLFKDAPAASLTGEASPSYLWHPRVPERIYAKQPAAKIIISLRNPIARAFSQYRMDLADGLAPIPFYDLITCEFASGQKVYGTGHLYVELGQYAAQVKRYLDMFGKTQVLILLFDDLTVRPREVLARIAAFLKIRREPFDKIQVRLHNQNKTPRYRLIRRVLRHRSVRQTYRSLVPLNFRRAVRATTFGAYPSAAIDAQAIQFLRSLYEPEMEELEAVSGITLPEVWI